MLFSLWGRAWCIHNTHSLNHSTNIYQGSSLNLGQRGESELLPFLREHRKGREIGEYIELYTAVKWHRKHFVQNVHEVYLWYRGRINAIQGSNSWVLKDCVAKCRVAIEQLFAFNTEGKNMCKDVEEQNVIASGIARAWCWTRGLRGHNPSSYRVWMPSYKKLGTITRFQTANLLYS